jgi:hypothetical protein
MSYVLCDRFLDGLPLVVAITSDHLFDDVASQPVDTSKRRSNFVGTGGKHKRALFGF